MNPFIADLMFTFTKGNIISEAIAHYTHCRITHVQTIIGIGINGTLQVMSADEHGLQPHWVNLYDYHWACILTCPELTLKQRDGICSWMWSNKDTPYDFLGLASFVINIDMNTEARVFCSESVYEGYLRGAGVELLTGIDHCYLSPRDLWISPKLVTLDGSQKEVR